MRKEHFYVTSYSTGIEYHAASMPWQITPLFCNNSIQHAPAIVANGQPVLHGWLYINVCGMQTSIVFELDAFNNWFEFENAATGYPFLQGVDMRHKKGTAITNNGL